MAGVTLPGDGSVVETIDGAAGAQRQVVHVANQPDTQPVSGSVSVSNLPATQAISGTVAVSNFPAGGTGLTDTELRATPVPVSGTVAATGTFWQATQPVSLALQPLPTGAATEATLASVAGTVATTDAVAPASPVGQLILGVRRDADSSPVSADNDFHPLTFNSTGRLKVSVMPADQNPTTGSIIASAGQVAMDCARISNLSISMVATSLVGHNATFEVSNNTTNGTDGNWYGVQVVRSNANTVEATTGVLAATPAYMWQVNVSDYGWIRIRATAHTSGTAAYTLAPSAFATEPIPASQVSGTQPVSGTVTATVANATLAAGTAQVGDVGVAYRANNTGAASGTHIVSAATTNATIVKASAGRVVGWSFFNASAAAKFVKLHNIATSPTAGTGVVRTIGIPAGGIAQLSIDGGIGFATGIGMTIVGAAADADATAVAAGDVVGDIFFA